MGVTIHYQGKLDHSDLIHEFCEEMEDISKAMEWEYHLINEWEEPDQTKLNEWEDTDETNLKGVIISPHKKSEPLVLMFDRSGTMRNAFMMKFVEEDPELTYSNHTKTQFAPPEVHIAVVKLLKYIHKKYITNLEVYDEGGYWETGNAALVKERIDFLNSKMDELENTLKTLTIEDGDSTETIADKMEQLLNDTFLKNKSQKKKGKR